MSTRTMDDDCRTPEQLREHYEIEKELANRLRRASRQERRSLYSSLYDELFRRVPHHPQLTRKASPQAAQRNIRAQMSFLRRFVGSDARFLEVGPGDCGLSFEVAKIARQVFAVDVSDEITRAAATPANFALILSDGCSVPVPRDSIDVAYSNQLMEHLHPDDALEQLGNIHAALVRNGAYICITPNALTGPHDVSKHFDAQATGFHLKEFTVSELSALFRQAGFSRLRAYSGARGFYVRCPVRLLTWCETLLAALPAAVGRTIAHSAPFRLLFNVRLVGIK
ncbi:MAG: class I SAM-dependent methyltransferase [Rhodocyclaceae bacterium]|nr:class I SAM-dependent methyltransferase [Rhodocyclaceae bacterium]